MDYDLIRVENWTKNFYEFLKIENIDLIPLFSGRITFLPQYDKANSIKPILMELDDRFASKEQIERMNLILNEFYSKNII